MDTLTDILRTIRLRGAIQARLVARGRWGIDFAASTRLRFALVTDGACSLVADTSAEATRLRRGDCFLLVGPDPFSLRDQPHSPTRPCAEILDQFTTRRLAEIGHGEESAQLLLGWFTFERGSLDILASLLPPVTCFSLSQSRFRTTEAALELLELEATSTAPGADLIVGRLGDILLVEAIRANLAAAGSHRPGLLALLADPRLARTLHAIHGDASHPWTLGEMAKLAGMSRSAFAARFRSTAGQPAMDYVLSWRMRLATLKLQDANMPLSQVARSVGYEADSAFGRAFKRVIGLSPGAYRQTVLDGTARPWDQTH
ncbi:helix-turn-helix domain-containing protein [Pseudooceanicola sp. 216_PA32_1]|uniref:Helix-turn-helix domain-containing protein n=1 Tax=Pseudooceanicola pacificus TaxID=2676438 RepID=A0A844WDU8_9RHOB|nr:AraC family transcriptional regulator [Pseudooceanicola pacificus]MWB77950.1 helix-turn-helix domain-containing protein [Pseudooceanicola pacificus]